MNVFDVMGEIGNALRGIYGLQVTPYWAETIDPPAAIVEFPDSLSYDSTLGRGSDHMVVPLVVAVARADMRSACEQLAAYADGSGPKSVKAAVEAGSYTFLDSARVASAEFGVLVVGGTEYLAATFTVDVIGEGA